MAGASQKSDEVLVALRRVIRAIDLHSRKLVQTHGLTGPQALILKEVVHRRDATVGQIAQQVSLSQATVTDILNRLERRGLIQRERSHDDRRRVHIRPSDAAIQITEQAPPLLQERFSARFAELQDWEQSLLLASLQRIASMMDAEGLDAAPILSSGAVTATPEAVQQVVEPRAEDDPAPGPRAGPASPGAG